MGTATRTINCIRRVIHNSHMELHSVPLSTAQISMRGSPLLMVKLKEYHTQKLDTTAMLTGLSFKRIQNLTVLHSVLLNIAQTSMRDIPLLMVGLREYYTQKSDTTAMPTMLLVN